MKPLLTLLTIVLLLGACRSQLVSGRQLDPSTYRIEGTRYADPDELARAAFIELLELGQSDQREAYAYDAAYSMERHLRNAGYPDAIVDFEIEGDVAVFDVKEGRIAAIYDVQFEGVSSFPEATLREYFDFPGDGFLGHGPVLYPAAKIDEAAANVKSYYLSKGYFRVDVGAVRKERGADATCMNLVVPVEEGEIYRLRDVAIEGDACVDLPLEIWQGKPYHGGVRSAIVTKVRNRVLDEGYPFAEVRSEVLPDDEAKAIDLRIEVKKGERTRLDQVRFEGQRRTITSFMRRRVPMVQGQYLRRLPVRKSVSNLYATGVFGSLDMSLEPTRPGYADMVFDVQESDSRQWDFGVGYGTWDLLRATAVYRDFNFLGRGLFFQARGIAGMRYLSLDTVFEDPWILGRGWVLSWKAGVARRIERFYTSLGLYTELYVERQLSGGIRLRGGYRFRTEDAIEIDAGFAESDLFGPDSLSRSAGLWTNVRWDKRDHLFVPTRGWIAEADLFWSTPYLGANLDYLGLMARTSYFVPLAEGSVLALNAQLASKEILNSDLTLPIQERFFLGGRESVRVYGQDELTPRGPGGVFVGGLTALEAHIEWRKRIINELHFGLFYDVGMVAIPSFDFDGAWGHGPGAGLRYNTPVGPLRVDVGYNPGELYASTGRWHVFFAFGFSF